MGVLGAEPGDLVSCLFGGSSDACRRVYFGYYLWPHLQNMLEQLELIRTPVPSPPRPQPDPSPWLLHELVPILLAPHFGDPSPQPSLPAEFRLETTIKFRDGLQAVVKVLDEEIKGLGKVAKVKGR